MKVDEEAEREPREHQPSQKPQEVTIKMAEEDLRRQQELLEMHKRSSISEARRLRSRSSQSNCH